jgi:hypothetical protein
MRWLLLERQLTAGEVTFGGWALFAFSYVLFVARIGGQQSTVVLMLSSMVTGSVAMLFAAGHLLVARRFALAGLLVVIAFVTSFAGGIIQLDCCPHATYVQVMGISIAIRGDACNNPRQITPWWMH